MRKLHLAQIMAYVAKNKKTRKIDIKSQQKNRFLRKQREEENFWDKHKNLISKYRSDKSKFDKCSLNK